MLALDDHSRIGALRFCQEADGPFITPGSGKLPPIVRLAALLRDTEAIHKDTESVNDLRCLLGEGSPLGGARPKSAVELADGSLGIAKFPKPDDTRDIAAGEILALTLAGEPGIRTAAHQLQCCERTPVVVHAGENESLVPRVLVVAEQSVLLDDFHIMNTGIAQDR